MADYSVPDVTVEQIFVTANPTLAAPDLPTVILGQSRQIQYRQSAGEYSGVPVVVSYPDLKIGATVQSDSVAVYLSNNYGIFEVPSTQYDIQAENISIEGGIALDVRAIENSQVGETSGIFFTDTSVNFYAKLTSTATIVVSSPSDNQKTFNVIEKISNNVALIKDSEYGDVKPVTSFGSSLTSLSTTLVLPNIAVASFIIGSAVDSYSFTSTYSASDTVISEPTVKSSTAIVPGDYFVFYNGSTELFVKKVIAFSSTSGAILDSSMGSTIGLTNAYKVFHPVLTKDANRGLAGDYVVANQSAVHYYAEVASFTGVNTITLATSLRDINAVAYTVGWTTGDSFRIYRGARKNTDSNVYDAYINVSNFTADILVNYTADRTDLNSDIQPITSLDDVTSILGYAVPENPLALAAAIHIGAAPGNLFYAIGTDGDTAVAHTKALEVIEAKEVYTLVPLSQDLDVIATYKGHVDVMSQPKEKMERIALVNRNIHISDEVVVGPSNKVIGGMNSSGQYFILGMVNSGALAGTGSNAVRISQPGIGYAANIGDVLVVYTGDDTISNTKQYSTIEAISPNTGTITLSAGVTYSASDSFQVISYGSTEFGDAADDLTVLQTGNVVNLLDSNLQVTKTSAVRQVISTVSVGTSNFQYAQLEDTVLGSSLSNKTFSLTTAPLNKLEQAQYMRDYAASILDRRVTHVYAPLVKMSYSPVEAPTTETSALLPGYYMAVVAAAMKSSNTPHQPMTNMPMPISAQLYYSNTYFKPTYLDIIASGGNYILVQSSPDSLPYCRQQLTTDMTTIESRELSITTAIDWYSKLIRNTLRRFIGRYNITDNYLAQLKGVANSTAVMATKNLKYLKDVKIDKLYQDPIAPDEIYADLTIGVFYPANKIKVRLYI